jgi:16S rRNA (guanine966-N2)-methyltransferase
LRKTEKNKTEKTGGLRVRIIAGEAKGRKLKTVKGMSTRPTSDRVKEAMFNILGPRIIGAKVLDVFAGTGNLGLEALSRGAQKVVFIEKSLGAYRIVQENIALSGFRNCELIKGDAIKTMQKLAGREKFDLIFLDPPYHCGLVKQSLQIIQDTQLLDKQGLIVAETAKDEVKFPEIAGFILFRVENYGDTSLSFYQHE